MTDASEATRIFKYTFPISDVVTIPMPGEVVKFLPMVEPGDYGWLTVWAEVFPDAPVQDHVLRVLGTGHPMPHIPLDHVGSCRAGMLVWHVYHDYTKRSLR